MLCVFRSRIHCIIYVQYVKMGGPRPGDWEPRRMETLRGEQLTHCVPPRAQTRQGTHSDGDEEIYLTHNVGNCLEV